MLTIRRYYDELDATLRQPGPISLGCIDAPAFLVVTQRWNRLTDKALGFALRLSPDVLAVHVTALEGGTSAAFVAGGRKTSKLRLPGPE
ncbi:MAG: hypothetical protein AB7I72_03640 [Parvibaculaceae bacterium]